LQTIIFKNSLKNQFQKQIHKMMLKNNLKPNGFKSDDLKWKNIKMMSKQMLMSCKNNFEK